MQITNIVRRHSPWLIANVREWNRSKGARSIGAPTGLLTSALIARTTVQPPVTLRITTIRRVTTEAIRCTPFTTTRRLSLTGRTMRRPMVMAVLTTGSPGQAITPPLMAEAKFKLADFESAGNEPVCCLITAITERNF